MRVFAYVGPESIRKLAETAPSGTPISSPDALRDWAARPEVMAEGGWSTFTIDAEGRLLLALRRTEHVACAGGAPVLAAGEVRIGPDGDVAEISNNSTGYCPAEDCWAPVAAALDALEIERPEGFTFTAIFRRCPKCAERNLVKDSWFHCAFCDAPLPENWNFADPPQD